MTDILEMLNAEIKELGQRRQASSRSSRERGEHEAGTGTPTPLKMNGLPVLPVVPVVNDNILGNTASGLHNSGDGVNDRRENPPIEYVFTNTGTTGSAGTLEGFRGLARSRECFDNGNDGNSPGPAGDPAQPAPNEIGYLAEHGLFIDFETRSAIDLKVVGSSVYAESGTTDVWVACYCIGSGPVCVWYPGDPVPSDLAAHVRSGLPLIAHNAAFERTIWS